MQRIIVLDDNYEILEALSLVLKRKPMDVVILSNPDDLEKYLLPDQQSLLLMDIFMGRYDGRKICRQLKDNPRFYQMPVILFSAQAYTAESVAESGADAILNKPFSIYTLFDVIDNTLSKAH